MWKKKIGIDSGSRRKNIQTGQTIGEPMEDFQTGQTIGSGGWCKKKTFKLARPSSGTE